MSDSHSTSARRQDFDRAATPQPEIVAPEIDAVNWEPLHEHEELNYDPPQSTYDPARTLELTPFGTIEHDVKGELDPAARRTIEAVQQQEPQIEDEFRDLRGRSHHRDDYESRMTERFHQACEHDHELER